MGQKVNPIGFRIAVNKNWRSRWFCNKRDFGKTLVEDVNIRERVYKALENAAIADIVIERYANRVRVNISSARPGVIIGRKGQDIERIRGELAKVTGKEIYVEIHEIKNADTNAQLVSENISVQLERRVSYRRAMKRAIRVAMEMGVHGIKIRAAGRLGGSEIARVESYKEGRVPLHTLRENIEYGFSEAHTTAGLIGVKVWICRTPEEPAKAGGGRR
ncbi:MAG: 30S ribosomal protein S3 [Verrucomicrobia bacterium]|nr:30S ribosomal protein S3 [Verrucomicrobiota bacterium]